MSQVWFVTGSSRGLGRAIVEAGLAADNKVLATARDIESLHDPGKNSACPLISSRSPHSRSDQSEPSFAGIRPTSVARFRAAQIVGARFGCERVRVN